MGMNGNGNGGGEQENACDKITNSQHANANIHQFMQIFAFG